MQENAGSELETLLNSTEPAAVLDAILGSTPSGAFIASAPDGKILRVSDYAVQLFGRPRSVMEGCTLAQWDEYLPAYDASRQPIPVNDRPLARALLGETTTGIEGWVAAGEGELIPCLSNAAPIRNGHGQVIGAINSVTDLRYYKDLEGRLRQALDQQVAAVAQRETLYRELSHRVKNHLQLMSNVVALEARSSALNAIDLADHIQRQLRTMAAVYKCMDEAEAHERLDTLAFLQEVCRPYESPKVRLNVWVRPDDLTLSSEQAGPIGMLVNEAVCNSHKHAFRDRDGQIEVSVQRLLSGRLRLEVGDSGDGWGTIDPNDKHHGLGLMRLFARLLDAELELDVHSLGGALVAAEMPGILP